MQKSKGARKLTNNERIALLENRVQFLLDAFQTVGDSVAEQASACQAMLKVLADLHPDRRMVKCVTEEGRVFYEFKTAEEIEAAKAAGQPANVLEVSENGASVQSAE